MKCFDYQFSMHKETIDSFSEYKQKKNTCSGGSIQKIIRESLSNFIRHLNLRIPVRKSATCIIHYVLLQYETVYKVLK